MSDEPAPLDEALERVITAAREHLAAVRAADGAVDDRQVWQSYVTLNNASYQYDQRLLEQFGEVTPWDTEPIDTSGTPKLYTAAGVRVGDANDPYPAVVSVRQRRDFRVPSVAALLAAATQAAARMALPQEPPAPASVGEAVLELLRDGDGSMAGLDVPELEPAGGVVTVSEVAQPLDLATGALDGAALFAVGSGERLVGRLDEQPFPPSPDGEADSGGPAGGEP